jgi:hypothetical protein
MLCIPLTADFSFPINIHQFGGRHLSTFQVIQIKQAMQACPDPYNCAISILQLVQYVVLVTVAGGYTHHFGMKNVKTGKSRNVLASFGWIVRFGSVMAVDCTNDENQRVTCASDIAEM